MSIGSWSFHWAKTQQLNSDWLAQTSSTQTWAKDSLAFVNPALVNPPLHPVDKKLGHFEKVYFCDSQLAGRGQGSNTWTNPNAGTSLLSTWVYTLKSTPPPFLTLMVGLALTKACDATWSNLAWSLKAQNDLYLEDKKVAGLLLETISQGDSHILLIGLGFNILNHPQDLPEATSLAEHLVHPLTEQEWNSFLSRFFLELLSLIQNESTSNFELSPTEKKSLLHYLNRNPRLTQAYLDIDDKGNLKWH